MSWHVLGSVSLISIFVISSSIDFNSTYKNCYKETYQLVAKPSLTMNIPLVASRHCTLPPLRSCRRMLPYIHHRGVQRGQGVRRDLQVQRYHEVLWVPEDKREIVIQYDSSTAGVWARWNTKLLLHVQISGEMVV